MNVDGILVKFVEFLKRLDFLQLRKLNLIERQIIENYSQNLLDKIFTQLQIKLPYLCCLISLHIRAYTQYN